MKIAIVCYPTFGGSGVLATELGMSLGKHGHEVHFIAYKKPVRLKDFDENIFFHEVKVPEYPLFNFQPYELALSTKLVEVIKLYSIDLMHVHYAIPHAYAAYMAKKMLLDEDISIPIVTTLHGTDITLVGSHPFYRPAVTFSINHSDCVTAVSESLKQDTLRLFDIKTEIKVIPNFIDTKKFENKEKPCERSLLAPTDDKIITHISNFRPLKRINDVIDVFEQISTNVSSKLLMVGEGPEKSKAMAYVKSKGLNEKVVFLGNSNEIDKILCYSDLFLLPSEMESFGLVALEAMANGVPVISSNAGGLSEVNKHGFSGFLSDVGDVNSMAKNALELLLDEEKLNKFKKQAKKQAQLFNIDKVVTEYEDIYKRALTK